MLYVCRLWFLSRPNPCILRQILVFVRQCLCVPFQMVVFCSPILSNGFVPVSVIPSVCWGGGAKIGGEVYSNEWFHVWVRDAIFLQIIYCAKINPEPDTHSSSWVHKGLGALALWSNLDYNLATAITVRPLDHPVTFEMGLSIFAAMSWLKVSSKTSAFLPTIPSTERENGDTCLCWL